MRIEGHTLAEQDELSERFEELVVSALHRATTTAALNLTRTALTAAGESVADDVVVLWNDEVPELVAYLDGVYDAGALEAAHELAANLPLPPGAGIPGVPDPFVLDYLGTARNRLKGVGDDLWENVRTQLTDGVAAGDTITQLAARVQTAANVSEARARTIARTELVGASNAGTHAQVLLIVPDAVKEWVATHDGRTRHTHLDADGDQVQVTEAFVVGASHLRWPGDPGGAAGEVVNCRCTLIYDVDDDAEPAVSCECGVQPVVGVSPLTAATKTNVGPCTCAVTYYSSTKSLVQTLTPQQHQLIFDAFMGKQPISPAYGGAKIHKRLDEARDVLLASPSTADLASLSADDLLAVVDELYAGAKKHSFTGKYHEWLSSPAGKKAAPTVKVSAKKKLVAAHPVTPDVLPTPSPVQFITHPEPPAPTHAAPELAPPPLPSVKPKPKASTLKFTGKTLGSHGAEVWVDPEGGRWLFKPQDKFMTELDVALARVQSKAKATRTGTYEMTLDGQHGSIQYMYDGSTEAFPGGSFSPTALSADDLAVFQQEQIFDWLISNFDTHSGQWVRLPTGELVGVDKGQAFKFFGGDKLDWNYVPVTPLHPDKLTYSALWKSFIDGKIELQDPTTGPLGEFLGRLMTIPDQQYKELLRPYAEALPFKMKHYASVEDFLTAAVARKNALRTDFEDFWSRAVAERTKKFGPPKLPPPPAPSPLVSIVTPPLPSPTQTAGVPTLTMPTLSLDEVIDKIFEFDVETVLAEAITSNGVPMRAIKKSDHLADYVTTEYYEHGKWHPNHVKMYSSGDLDHEHPGVEWHEPGDLDDLLGAQVAKSGVKAAQATVTVAPAATPSALTYSHKKLLLSWLKSEQPITPGWGGSKVYKQLQAIKAKVQENPIYAGLTDRQLLALMDEVAEHKTDKTYVSVTEDWLKSDAGKKYTDGVGVAELDVAPPVTIIPAAPQGSHVGQFADDVLENLTDAEVLQVAQTGQVVSASELFNSEVLFLPDGAILAVGQNSKEQVFRLIWTNGHLRFQVQTKHGDWVGALMQTEQDLAKALEIEGLELKIPQGTKLAQPGDFHGKKPMPSDWKPPPPSAAAQAVKQTKAAAAAAKKAVKKAGKKVNYTTLVDQAGDISFVAAPAKDAIFKIFKDKSPGSYLAGSPDQIFKHLRDIRAKLKQQGGVEVGHLSDLQLLRIIDEASAKKIGTPNTHKFESKITEWIKTPAGKQAAEDIVAGKPLPTPFVPKKPGTTTEKPHFPKPETPKLAPKVESYQVKSQKTREFVEIYDDETADMMHELQLEQGQWTAAQKSSIKHYTGAGYGPINGCLRGTVPCSPQTLEHIHNIQTAMRRSDRRFVLYRGTHAQEFPGFTQHATFEDLKTLEGRTIRLDGFSSTSNGSHPAFHGRVRIEFEIDAGVPLAWIKPVSAHKSENEVLLAAGLEGDIISVTQMGMNTKVRIRVRVP